MSLLSTVRLFLALLALPAVLLSAFLSRESWRQEEE
jgi:hypothetical protein